MGHFLDLCARECGDHLKPRARTCRGAARVRDRASYRATRAPCTGTRCWTLHRAPPRRGLASGTPLICAARGAPVVGMENRSLWTLAQQELAAGHHAAALRATRVLRRLHQARRGRLENVDDLGRRSGGRTTGPCAHAAARPTPRTKRSPPPTCCVVDSMSQPQRRRPAPQRTCNSRSAAMRVLLPAWLAHARAARPAARTLHRPPGKTAEPREPCERLVDTGLRLNEQTDSAALHAFLIDEVAELLGARRVLLVLETAPRPGHRRRPGAARRDAASRVAASHHALAR